MEIKIKRFTKSEVGKLVGFFDVSLNNIVIKGFKLLKGDNGLFLGLPREKGKDGEYYNSILFEDLQDKEKVEKVLIDYYNSKK